ncbi:MAG: hypothetical protein ACRD0I_02470 [Acidimicrobiales bacterium]
MAVNNTASRAFMASTRECPGSAGVNVFVGVFISIVVTEQGEEP